MAVQAAGHIPTPPVRFWRVVFWIVVVHFACFGLIAIFWVREDARPVPTFHQTYLVAMAKRSIYFVVINTARVVSPALVAADSAALYLVWQLAHGSPNKRAIAIYLGCVFGVLGAHVAAIAYVASAGTIRTPQMTYGFSDFPVFPFVYLDLLLTAPAWLMLVGIAVLGWQRAKPGICTICGYDLRATPDRCPECGVVPAKAKP